MALNENADVNFAAELESKVRRVNEVLGRILSQRGLIGEELEESLRYVLEGPGKRVRSAVVLWCCELVSGKVNHDAEIAAAAVEMVHTYSLIHDDLPAMDNDDYRRGRLTCHKKFDEATAILAGDALLTLAFELLAKETGKPETAVRLVAELAEAAGPAGMVAGQMADLKAANGKANEKLLNHIHLNKTAKMFRCAAGMGGICGGADEEQLKCLREYGLRLGLGFQISDDILDVCGTSEQLGKTSGKDVKQGKATYPAVMGIEKSIKLAEKLADEAIASLELFGAKADMLRRLTGALLNRTR
ncbi:MAG: polyprenyl synthetase family protein [Sedimentisphaerales bacterium]